MWKKLVSCLLLTYVLLLYSCVPVLGFGPSGTTYHGIDVSEWQGSISYESVKNSGIEVVYIRTSEGFNYTDPYFLKNYNGAKQYGLKVGFYHYLTARNTR